MKPETKELRAKIKQVIEPLRLHCEFILRNGKRANKKCGMRAKKSNIKGIANIQSNLCWRHRRLLKKEYIADIVSFDS